MGVQTLKEDSQCDPQLRDCSCSGDCLLWVLIFAIVALAIALYFERKER